MIVILDDFIKVYFFNFDGNLAYYFENQIKISSICVVNNLFAMITVDGYLSFYEICNDEGKLGLKNVYKHNYSSFSGESSYSLYFDNKLFCSFGHKKYIYAIHLC